MIRARLLKRVFDIDIEQCPNCGGELKIIASIEEPAVIGRLLAHLGLPARAPPREPRRRHGPRQGGRRSPAGAGAARRGRPAGHRLARARGDRRPGVHQFPARPGGLPRCGRVGPRARPARFGRSQLGRGRRVQVEFVSANPTGPLHVGHGRGAAYGAAVADLREAVGFAVHREYYVNDAGRQMDILAASVWQRYLELCGEAVVFPANAYRGDYVWDIAATLHRVSSSP